MSLRAHDKYRLRLILAHAEHFPVQQADALIKNCQEKALRRLFLDPGYNMVANNIIILCFVKASRQTR